MVKGVKLYIYRETGYIFLLSGFTGDILMTLTSMKPRNKTRTITMQQRFHLLMFRIFGLMTLASLILGITMVLVGQNSADPQPVYNTAIISFLVLPIFAITAWFSFRKFSRH